jgi:HK97 family phage major capsid protein
METQGREVKLHKMFAFVTATEELLEDAPRLESRLRVKAPEAIRWKATDAIMYGDGVGKPKGYFGSDALVSIAKESGQAAKSVVAKNIAKMYARNLNPGRAHWIVNSDVLPEIMTLQIGSQPIWTPPNSGFKNAPGGFLLGRPIQFSEHAKTVGDKGDIQFVDPMGYYAPTKRGGIKFDSSIHLYFDYDLSAFRWTFRFGGQPYLSAPVTPKNGNSEKSHFVTLNERS